jgi:isopenicillin-N epimerase
MAAIPLPDAQTSGRYAILHGLDVMRDQLLRRFQIEVPVFPWPAPPKRLLRVSAQLYNAMPDYVKLAEAVKVLLGRTAPGPGRLRETRQSQVA